MSIESIRLFFSGDEYYREALASIDSARSEILFESYIYDLDPIGLRFLNALGRARARGVHVSLLVDGIGSFNWIRGLETECRERDLQLRIYHPLPFFRKWRWSWRSLRRSLLLFRRINQRNHRKTIVIDGREVYTGSLNVSQVHTKEFLGAQAWRDTGARARFADGQNEVEVLRRAFFHTWRKARSNRPRPSPISLLRKLRRQPRTSSCFRVNSRAWWRYLLLRDLLRRIRTAQERILITNAYFLPRRALLTALRRTAKRGVRVGLCLPQKTDVWIVREASRFLYYKLLKAGIEIYEYQPSVLHAKTLVIDNWATVGSHNLNHRSLMHDLEVEMEIRDEPCLRQLVEQWGRDVALSKRIQQDDLGKFPFWRRWLSRAIYWFRYWL